MKLKLKILIQTIRPSLLISFPFATISTPSSPLPSPMLVKMETLSTILAFVKWAFVVIVVNFQIWQSSTVLQVFQNSGKIKKQCVTVRQQLAA